jgi:hypothetical protein
MMLRVLMKSSHSRLRTWSYNIGFVLSFILLPCNYSLYRLMKRIGTRAFAAPQGIFPPLHKGTHKVSIQGFMHSANTFLVMMVQSHSRCEIYSHSHQAYGVALSVNAGIKPVVLVRRPREVMLSAYRRSNAQWYGHPYIYSRCGLILCWIFYHQAILKYRRHCFLVMFEDITDPRLYANDRRHIFEQLGILLTGEPDFGQVNVSTSSAIPLPSFALRDWLLHIADRQYNGIREFARKQRQNQLSRAVPDCDPGLPLEDQIV